jgi:hypothetical protein
LEQTIEDWLRGYLLNRANKYTNRVKWVTQRTIDGPVEGLDWKDAEIMVRQIASEAADHIMVGICEAFTFTDDEAVVPNEAEPEVVPSPQVVYLPDDSAEQIIRLIEAHKVNAQDRMDASVDHGEWGTAYSSNVIVGELDFILRRIKAEDYTPLAGDQP